MKNLKQLSAAFALTLVLGLSAFAGETQTPPCPPPDPGEVSSPPCATAQLTPDDSVAPGQTSTPPSSNEASELSITATIELVQSWLSIY